MTLNARSLKNLEGVKQDLVTVVSMAHEMLTTERPDMGFIVTCGLRTKKEQEQMVKVGASRTMNSKHLTGDAVDLAPTVNGDVKWDWPLFHILDEYMMRAAFELGIKLTWGGRWKSFPDGPHFELVNVRTA